MGWNACSAVSVSLFAASVLASGCGATHSGGAGGNPGTPASVAVSSGDNQSAVVSMRLPQLAAVLVSDAEGRAVAGVQVSFTIVDGGGSVDPASSTTDAAGRASTGWTLGPTPGLNHLQASVAGVTATATFAATGTAPVGVPSSVSKKAGDGQSAAPGTAVAVAPVVVVRDASGTVVAGADVTFAVTGGGGAIQVQSARTDADGLASCGAWTLGAAVSLNTMTATVTGIAPATFSASAVKTSTEVNVTVPSPTAGQTVGVAMRVVAMVSSTYQIASVTVSAAGTTVPMTFGTFTDYCGGWVECPAWLGTISLAGQPRGMVTLAVTAKDVLGNTTNVIVTTVFDEKPVLVVSAPLDETVARPGTNIAATCTDDDPMGCRSLTATIGMMVLATGTGSISQVVNLSAWEGKSVAVVVTGVDSIGQQATVSRTLYVESSPRLAVRAEVSGTVWDAAGTRVLYLDTSGTTPALAVTDTALGTTQVLETGPDLVGTWGGYGSLTPSGAAYAHGKVSGVYPFCWLFEWRGGALAELGGLNSCLSLEVAGGYAIFNEAGAGAGTTTLKRRDLATGTTVTVSQSAGNIDNGVASNGDVAYWTYGAEGYNIHRWRDGTSQALTSDSSTSLWNTYPVTDGVNVVYRKHTPCCGEQTYRIAMHDGSTETILSRASTVEPVPGAGYAVAGGHVAYTSEDLARSRQVWRHSPSGEEQLTIFGSSSSIDAIAPDGTVLLAHAGRRFRATPGAALQDIGSTLGRVVVRDGKFLVLLGRTVMEALPQ